jgi:hypothetical protein
VADPLAGKVAFLLTGVYLIILFPAVVSRPRPARRRATSVNTAASPSGTGPPQPDELPVRLTRIT